MKYAHLILAAFLAFGLTACGNRGKLKSPSQIAAEQAKKDARQKKEDEKKQKTEQADRPAEETR